MTDTTRDPSPEDVDVPAENPDDAEVDSRRFPSTKFERSAIAAKTGLKVGANYARYLARKAGRPGDATELKKALNDRNARDIFGELARLRGTALKLAQGMSLDPGMLPEEFTDIMAQAQYSVPPMNRALVRRILRRELGDDPDRLFASFESDAVAAASIGQVHRAVLKDGRPVAIKVQYPNVRATIESDLQMAMGLAKRVAPALLEAGRAEPFVDEVRDMMRRETDYVQEGESIEFFAAQYADDRIVTPRWVPKYSTGCVLTMTWVEGRHLGPWLATDPPQEKRDAYGQLLLDFVHRQVTGPYSTIHADVHPGNLLFRDDGRLGVIDYGAIKTFPRDFLDSFLLIYVDLLTGRKDRLDMLYDEVEVLDPSMKPELRARISSFFGRFADVVLAPYKTDRYDFGTSDFRDAMMPLFREASTFNAAVGSRHFVFINRVLFGLLSILAKLEARVDTRAATTMLDTAVRQIEERRSIR